MKFEDIAFVNEHMRFDEVVYELHFHEPMDTGYCDIEVSFPEDENFIYIDTSVAPADHFGSVEKETTFHHEATSEKEAAELLENILKCVSFLMTEDESTFKLPHK